MLSRFRRTAIAIALVTSSSIATGCSLVPASVFAVDLMAENIAFAPLTLQVPASTSFTIHFRNADAAGTLHTVEIRLADQVTQVEGQAETDGGKQVDYAFDPLPPGKYVFICSVHPIPSMTGTLVVR